MGRSQFHPTFYASLGNIVEFYDFTLFAYLMPVMAKLFFPATDPYVSMLLAASTFGVSFIARPIGALFFGRLGDYYDRSVALIASIICMVIATIGLAIMPVYEDAGVWAPLGLVIFRLLQAFSAGGEYSGAAIFAIENSDHKDRYKVASILVASSAIGSLLALAIAYILTYPGMPANAWRWGFLLGVVNSGTALIIRTSMRRRNPRIFEKIAKAVIPHVFQHIWTYYRSEWLASFMISGFAGVFWYTTFSFTHIYLTTMQGWSQMDSLYIVVLALGVAICGFLLSGYISTIWGGAVTMMIGTAFLITVGLGALFMIIQASSFEFVALGSIVLSLCLAFSQGSTHGVLVKFFPKEIRFRAYGVAYGLALAIFGGTANLVLMTLQKTIGVWGVISYLGCMGLIALSIFYCLREKEITSARLH